MKIPDVILLNGAPSAGKSQLTLALQARLPFVRMGIDDFIWDRVPASWFAAVQQFLSESRDADAAVAYGAEPPKLWRAYHRAVRACVAEGLGVVVDDAIVTREMLDDWMRALDGIDVFFVGVHCSVEELTLRERARRDRAPGSAVAAMKRVHAHAIYDLEVDSTTMPSSALAAQIIAALEARSGLSVFERMRGLGGLA